MSVLGAGEAFMLASGEDAAYQISRSLRFNPSDTSYLSRTPASAGNRRTWTWSGWVKRSGIGTNDPIFEVAGSSTKATQFALKFHSNDYISIDYGGAFYLQTTRLFRDPSAWMHLVVVVDTTLSTADNRVRLYVNGIEETVFTTRNNPNQNEDLAVNRTAAHTISASSNGLDGYLAEIHLVDGQALAPTDFGEYDDNNVWQPKKFTHGTAKHTGDWIGDTVGTPYSAPTGSSKAFDGDDSTAAAPTTSSAFVFTPSTPITGISKVRIRVYRDLQQNDDDGLQLNGTAIGSNWTAGAATSEVEFNVNNLTSLRWETNSITHWYKVYKIEIYYEGAYHTLVQGGINSFHLDFSDNSSNAALGTDSSGLGTTLPGVDFDGTGDHLESADHADYSLGTNDFTIEFFLYPREFDNYQALVMKYAGGPSNSSWWISDNNAGGIYFYLYYNGSYELGILSSGATMNLNKWNHVACVRDGSTARIYINGVQAGTGNIGTVALNDSATALRIGEDSQGSYDLDGIMSNVRLINGTCLYPNGTTFTVPSTPLTNVTNTKLLCCQSSSSATAATVSPNTLTTSGDPFATTKDDSDWTVNNLTAGLTTITSPNRPTWNAGTDWTRTNSNYSADYSRSGNSYSGIQATLSGSTTYHFYLTFKDSSGSYGGWYFNTSSSSPSNTVPNELGGNTLGLRTGHTSAGAHGDYATANGVSAGQSALSLSALQSSGSTEHSIEFVINTTVGKVWARKLGDSSYVGGGEPNNSSSTPSFSIPTGAQYFGYMAYQETGTSADFATSAGDVSEIDSLIDTPTNYQATGSGNNGGNYCTMNPLRNSLALSNGNLDVVGTSGWKGSTGTIGMSSGKWYWEYGDVVSNEHIVGIVQANLINSASTVSTVDAYGYGSETGGKYSPTGGSNQSYGSSWTTNDLIGVAFDADNGNLYFYKNGTVQNSGTAAFTGLTSGPYLPSVVQNGSSRSASLNFGQRGSFVHTPPTGYKSLCTTNLPDPAIADGSTAFDIKTFTANNGSQSISLGFAPDLVWTKSRANAYEGQIFDIVRGNNQELSPNATRADRTLANSLTFDSSGFTMPSNNNNANYGSGAGVAWAWDAGTSTVSNTDGSITSNVRASASNGVSIVTWTGQGSGSATVGHGLNAAPKFIIVKALTGTVGWTVGHQSIGWTKRVQLNTDAASSTSSNYWNDTAPTSSVFTSGANNVSNTFVAYCFAPVAGYSAFGSYTGNGSADGPFVYTGMRPAFVLWKRADAQDNWAIVDNFRSPFNVADDWLGPNSSSAESSNNSAYAIDMLSNGFKVRASHAATNASSGTYIWAAFCEHSFKTARAR